MRIGAVHYLNGKPLVHGLDTEKDVELISAAPSALASMLREGEISAGLVSVAACFSNPDLRIMPDISISCIGPAYSVKLFYKGRLESIRRVALDVSSLTSVLLARVILRERYNLQPEFIDMPPVLPRMLDECDAAVVIGDAAMQISANWGGDSIDLGEEWHNLTGLPFVFAVWAVNPALTEPRLADILHRAKASGLRHLPEISRLESGRLSLPVDVCLQYLTEIMSYDLTERHLEGLRQFEEKAQKHGFVRTDSELKLFKPY
jgi:chorismate dehydratase